MWLPTMVTSVLVQTYSTAVADWVKRIYRLTVDSGQYQPVLTDHDPTLDDVLALASTRIPARKSEESAFVAGAVSAFMHLGGNKSSVKIEAFLRKKASDPARAMIINTFVEELVKVKVGDGMVPDCSSGLHCKHASFCVICLAVHATALRLSLVRSRVTVMSVNCAISASILHSQHFDTGAPVMSYEDLPDDEEAPPADEPVSRATRKKKKGKNTAPPSQAPAPPVVSVTPPVAAALAPVDLPGSPVAGPSRQPAPALNIPADPADQVDLLRTLMEKGMDMATAVQLIYTPPKKKNVVSLTFTPKRKRDQEDDDDES